MAEILVKTENLKKHFLREAGVTADIMGGPLHPYTQALFSSIPKETPDVTSDRIQLTGEIPSAINTPRGCKFHTRCSYSYPPCERNEPVMEDAGNGHRDHRLSGFFSWQDHRRHQTCHRSRYVRRGSPHGASTYF